MPLSTRFTKSAKATYFELNLKLAMFAKAALQICSFADGVKLVKLRGESMQAAADSRPSSMVSVLKLDVETVSLLHKPSRTRSRSVVAERAKNGSAGFRSRCLVVANDTNYRLFHKPMTLIEISRGIHP